MREQHHSPSLLPYLAPGNAGAGLKIALPCEDPSTLTSYPFPFLLIDDADPLTRLIKAEFVTDSGSRIKDVFLLVQRDAYRFSPNQLTPLTNPDIDGFWQKTYQYHSQNRSAPPVITFQQQIDKKGNLTPFQSLFFCIATKAFFHPPCPSCGLPLQLCSNDQLLDSLGLQQYALSLKRTLFCPTCFSSGRGTDFYAHQKSASDPPSLKDATDLIRTFGQLVQEGNEQSGLPCPACPESERCYGASVAGPPPIVPFSFYPFHMLIYEAMSVNGLDFLALVAGASGEELHARLVKAGESGRAFLVESSRSERRALQPFLFHDEARQFLETLYLKLSFLGQIIAELFPEPEGEQPDPLLYVDKIWVRLTDRSSLLPYLWNFELSFIDLMRDPLDLPAHPRMPPAYALHLLGVIWFTALLVNSRQDVSQLHGALQRARDRALLVPKLELGNQQTKELGNQQNALAHAPGWMLGDDLAIPDDVAADASFAPENIFWHPTPCDLAEDWRTLWKEALGIGWWLFQASLRAGSAGTREEFLRQIEHLRARTKRELFAADAGEQHAARQAENEAIHEILSRIATSWRQTRSVEPSDEVEETVVLSRETDLEATLSAEVKSAPPEESETVILTSPNTAHEVEAIVDEEIFEETVVLSGKGLQESIRKKDSPLRKDLDELSETVILGSPGTREGTRQPSGVEGESIAGEGTQGMVGTERRTAGGDGCACPFEWSAGSERAPTEPGEQPPGRKTGITPDWGHRRSRSPRGQEVKTRRGRGASERNHHPRPLKRWQQEVSMASRPYQISVVELANGMRTCYRSDSTRAESLIEAYLETRLDGLSLADKLTLLEQLRHAFAPSPAGPSGAGKGAAPEVLANLFSLILGQRVAGLDLGSEDVVQRLAASLNSIFDQLNELVGIINATFGKETSALETIRTLIGSDLEGEPTSDSLAGYIGQIKEAFLIANQAARLAAAHEVRKILAELDPDHLAGDAEKGIRFGFMRKGELVEAYREKHGQIKKWFEADHFLEDFAREFERTCQRLHSEKGRAL